jgi:hypothetical protein
MADNFFVFLLQVLGGVFMIFIAVTTILIWHDYDRLIERAIKNNVGNYYVVDNKQMFRFHVEMSGEAK